MELRHLVVHVDKGGRARERIALAVTLAARHGARLTGLFADQPERRLTNVGRRSAAASARSARAAFEEAARGKRVKTEWWVVEAGETDVPGVAARYCRYADLAVVGQDDPESSRVPPRFAEGIFLESGRPVLVVPAAGSFPDVGRRVVVAWDGTREASRALHDALPLLAGAREVKVALLRGPRDRADPDDESSPSVLRHLQAHGIRAEYDALVLDPRSEVDALGAVLNLSFDSGADLVVMGGRGTPGALFPRAGKGIRAGLADMIAPVLASG